MRQFSIRNKLFITISLLVLVALSTSFYVVYSNAKKTLKASLQNEMNNSTALITNLVHSVASTSIENHLKSIAETQLEMVTGMYDQYMSGYYSEAEAKHLAAKLLLSQDIGTSGYLYGIDSRGNVVVHRNMYTLGSNVLAFPFAREQIRRKTGYIEYSWKNPDELRERDKALYMTYFEPWDWIISASAYKNEFTYLIDINNISKALAKVRFGDSGYPYIVAGNGDYIYHPSLTGNLYDNGINEKYVGTVEKILNLQQGEISYKWRNPGESMDRDKISFINYLPDYDWVVGSSAYLDELYQPLTQIRQNFLRIFLAYGLLGLLVSYLLSTWITSPLKALITHFKEKAPTDVQPITTRFSNDEVGDLAEYLNQFIDKLNQHHQTLATEINDRIRSEQALLESEQTFHTLFDHSFQFIALLDPEGRICKINKTALSFRQLTESDVLGQYFWETPWWQHSQALIQQLKEAYTVAKEGQVARFEAHSTEVREIYLDVSLKPVLNDEHQIIYIVAEARDVTDVRRAEQELQQAQKMESVGTLAGGIAHDFNNILGGILGTLTLLELKRKKGLPLDEETIFRHLNTVYNSALRAKDIVNQLLTLSRKYELDFIPLDLRQILEHVSLIARNSFDKSIQMDIELDDNILVQGDANSLEQVFLNICINAAHAMTIMRPQGDSWGGTLSIQQDRIFQQEKIGVTAGEYWRITIKDTGVGMDQATQKRIFEPFFSSKEKTAGSGLGLSMVYNIVKQHQGFIDIQSTPGSGTSVSIYLPIGLSKPEPVRKKHKENLEPGEGLILIIDDEEMIRNNASEILSESGYEVLTAENGQEGVEIFQQHHNKIDLVLLDLVMPIMSGRATFYALKKIDPKVKILLSSGFRQDDRAEEILNNGAAGFIQKPYSLFKLSATVKQLL